MHNTQKILSVLIALLMVVAFVGNLPMEAKAAEETASEVTVEQLEAVLNGEAAIDPDVNYDVDGNGIVEYDDLTVLKHRLDPSQPALADKLADGVTDDILFGAEGEALQAAVVRGDSTLALKADSEATVMFAEAQDWSNYGYLELDTLWVGGTGRTFAISLFSGEEKLESFASTVTVEEDSWSTSMVYLSTLVGSDLSEVWGIHIVVDDQDACAYFDNLKVLEAGKYTVVETEYDFTQPAVGFVKGDFTTGSEGTLKVENGVATLDITKGSVSDGTTENAGNNIWETRILVTSTLKVEEGKSYKISMDVYSLNGQQIEVLFNTDGAEVAFDGMYGQIIGANEKRTLSATVTSNATGMLGIVVNAGTLSEAGGEALLQVSNVTVEEIDGEAKDVFLIAGAPAVTNAGTGVGSMSFADGKLVYDMTAISTVDHENKLFLEGMTFNAGKLYTVKVTAKANKEITAKFYLNKLGGNWAPLVSKDVTFTETEQEFVFTMAEPLTEDAVMELLWQFGSEANSLLGGATVEISNIAIGFEHADSTAPVISGVNKEFTVYVDQEADLLAGVSATDDGENVDVTVSVSPALEVVDGKITPTEEKFYYVTYTAVDAAGNTASETAIMTVSPVTGQTVVETDYDFTDPTTGFVKSVFDAGSEGTLDVQKDLLTLNITKGAEENGVWNTKLLITSGLTLEAGKTYTIQLDVYSLNGQEVEVLFNRDGEEKGFGGLYGQVIAANATKNMAITVTPEETGSLGITVQAGMLNEYKGHALLKVSNVIVRENGGETKTLNFVAGAPAVTNEGTGAGSMSFANGALVYDMTAISETDYQNKLFLEGMTFNAGKLYTVKVTAKADKEITAKFHLNKMGTWAPVISRDVAFTETEQEFVFKMTAPLTQDAVMELLWQFGSEANSQLGGAKVEISSITVEAQKVYDDPAEIAGEDLIAPVITGVKDIITHVDVETDLMEGVGATDNGKPVDVQVAVYPEELEIVDGKITPSEEKFYYVVYTATDAAGNTATESAILTVDVITGATVVEKEYDFANTATGFVKADFTTESEGTLDVQENLLTLDITQGPSGNNVWETKLLINSGMVLEEGKTYKISLDVYSLNGQEFEILFNKDGAEQGFGALFSQMLAANEKRTFSFTTTPTAAGTLGITVQAGKLAETNGQALLQVSNVKVEEVDGETKTLNFVAGAPAVTNEGDGAGSMTISDGKLVYDMTAISTTDYHNKLFLEGITFKEGRRYTIKMTAKADKTITARFYLSEMGFWDPYIERDVTFTEDEQEFVFTMAEEMFWDADMEMLWQFGSEVNSQLEGGARIEISNITIESQMVYYDPDFTEDLTAPVISGVQNINAHMGEEVDLLAGVTATDETDGDFDLSDTDYFEVSVSPYIDVVDGKVTPDAEQYYFVTYTARDFSGNVAKAHAILAVEPLTGATVVEKEYNFANTATGFVRSDFTTGSTGTLDVQANCLTMDITKGPNGNNIWETKLIITTGLKLEAGKTYKLSLDAYSLNGQEMEFLFSRADGENFSALYGQMLSPNEKKNFSVTVTPDTTSILSIVVQAGKLAETNGQALLQISNVKIAEVDGETKTLNFVAGAPAVTNEGTGVGSGVIADGKFVYDMTAISATDYHNKLFLEGITFNAGKQYTVRMTAKADKEITAKFYLNELGFWDPHYISRDVTFTEAEQEFVFTLAEPFTKDTVIEMLWQFGSEANSQLGGAKIEISNIVIESRKVYDTPVEEEDLTAPTISGVENITTHVGIVTDLLSGVTATDNGESVDVQVSVSPAITVTDGKVTPDVEKFYFVTYTATDAFGNTATENAIMAVIPKLGQQHIYKDFDFGNANVAYVKPTFDGGSAGLWDVNAGSATLYITKGPSNNNNIWETKLSIATGVKLEAGKTYTVSLDVESLNGHTFEICYNRDNVEKAYGAQFGLNLAANENKTFTQTIAATASGSLNIVMQVGKLNNVDIGDILKVTNLKIEESGNVIKPTFAEGGYGVMSDGGGAGSSSIVDGNLVYDMTSIGDTDWHNKMMIDRITFKAGKLYTVRFIAKADKEITGMFFVNKCGTWDPIISKSVTFTTEGTLYEIKVSEDALAEDMELELLWQMGSATNKTLGSAKIEAQDVQILSQKKYEDQVPTNDTVAPVLNGVHELNCNLDKAFNLLSGVTATDDADGDVTGYITVEVEPVTDSSIMVIDGNIPYPVKGQYNVTYTVSDDAGNVATKTVMLTVKDPTAINGVTNLTVKPNVEIDLMNGISATDDFETDLVVSVSASGLTVTDGKVITETEGIYTLTYQVTDRFGNVQQKTATLKVDGTKPVFTLESDTITGKVDHQIDLLAGVTANDAIDGMLANISVSAEPELHIVDGRTTPTAAGTYTITYTVVDATGNEATATATLTVVDSKAPVFAGVQNWKYDQNDVIDLLKGITATDETLGDVTDRIQVSIDSGATITDGKVGPLAVGDYTVTYTVTDDNGNEETATAVFSVVLSVSDEKTEVHTYPFQNPDMSDWSFQKKGSAAVQTSFVNGCYRLNTSGTDTGKPIDELAMRKAMTFVNGVEYKVTYVFTISNAGQVQFRIGNSATSGSFTANEEHTATGNYFGDGNEGYIQLNLGRLPNGTQVDIRSIKIETIVWSEEGKITDNDFAYSNNGSATYTFGNGSGTVSFNDTSITMDITAGTTGNTDLSQTLTLKTGYKLKPNTHYTITMDIEATTAQGIGIMYGNDKQDNRLAQISQSLTAGTKHTVVFQTVSPDNTEERNLYIKLLLGRHNTTGGSNTVTVSNIKIEEYSGEKTGSVQMIDFLPVGFDMYNEPDVAQGVLNLTDKSATDETYANLVYTLSQIGTEAAHNVLSTEAVSLSADKLYTVRFTAKADKALRAQFVVNNATTAKAILIKELALTTDAQTFEFTLPAPLAKATMTQLLWQFGSDANNLMDSAEVTLSDVVILSQDIIEKDTQAPTFVGVEDKTVGVNTTVDLLDGVSATDEFDDNLPAITVTVSNGLTVVDGKVTPTLSGNYTVTYQVADKYGNVATKTAILSVEKSYGPATMYKEFTFDDPSLEGWEIRAKGSAQTAFVDGICRLTFTGTAATQADADGVFLKNMVFENGVEYKLTVKFVPAQTGRMVILCGSGNASNNSYAAGELHTVTASCFGDGTQKQIGFRFGKMPAGSVDIHSIELETIVWSEEGKITDTDFAYSNSSSANYSFGNGSGTVSYNDASITMNITTGTTGNTDLSQTLTLKTGYKLKPNTHYTITMDIEATTAQGIGIMYGNDKQDNRLAQISQSLTAGTKHTVVFQTVSPDNTEERNLYIKLLLGRHNTTGGSNTITVSNIKIEEYSGEKTASSDLLTFLPGGFAMYNEPDVAAGTLTAVDGKLVYNMTQSGTALTHNYVATPTFDLTANNLYTVKFVAKANADVTAKFFFNYGAETFEREIALSTTEQTYTFALPKPLTEAVKATLMWQFGGNSAAEISFSSICIEAQTKSLDNTAPTISGVKDLTCDRNQTVDLLSHVSAADETDDVAPTVTVTVSPALTVTNGCVTPGAAGTYALTYTTKDVAGNVTTATATLTVNKSYVTVGDPQDITFTASSASNVGGMSVVNGTAQGVVNGAYRIEGSTVSLQHTHYYRQNYSYSVTVRFVASAAGTVNFNFTGASAEYAFAKGENTVTHAFTYPSGTANRTNKIHFIPTAGNITVDILEIQKTNIDAINNVNYMPGNVTMENGTGAGGSLYVDGDKLVYNMSILGAAEGNNAIYTGAATQADKLYKVQFTAKADKDITGQFLIGDSVNSVSYTTAETVYTFTATAADAETILKWQFGSAANSALGSAKVELSDISIVEIEEEIIDLDVEVTVDGKTTVLPKGDAIPEEILPTKVGYTLVGLYTDKERTQKFDLNQGVFEDVTLYSVFDKNTDDTITNPGGDTDFSGATTAGAQEALYKYNTYFLPEKDGSNQPYVGDPMPYYENGTYYIYYLKDGGDSLRHSIYLVTTRDFVTYTEYDNPVLVSGADGDQDAWIGTGSVVKVGSTYYLFYTGHPNSGDEKIMVATGSSPTSFTKKTDFSIAAPFYFSNTKDFRDPQAYYDAATDTITLTVTAQYQGTPRVLYYTMKGDLSKVSYKGIVFTNDQSLVNVYNLECSDTFKIGNKWYITYSAQNDTMWYASSNSQYSGYGTPKRLDGKVLYAAKHVDDGNGNYYLIGWSRKNADDLTQWGGNLVVSKLVQKDNGDLTLAPVDAVVESMSNRRQLATADTHWYANASGRTYFDAFTCYETYTIRGEFSYTSTGSFGLAFANNSRTIEINPATGRIQLKNGSTVIAESSVQLTPNTTYSFTYVQDGSTGVFYVDGVAALTVRIPGASGKAVCLFAESNEVFFTSLRQYT